MPAPKYTDKQIEGAIDLIEAGQSLIQAARATGIPRSTIAYHCYKLGVDMPAPPAKLLSARNRGTRNGRVIRPFSAEDDRRLVEMRTSGASVSQIQKALGRARSSVVMRLMILARHEERALEEADT